MKPKNPYRSRTECLNYQEVEPAMHEAWQEGFDACVKWLGEPCDKFGSMGAEVCRRTCTHCWQELKQETQNETNLLD